MGNPGENAGSVEFEQYVGVAFFEFGIGGGGGGNETIGLGLAVRDVVEEEGGATNCLHSSCYLLLLSYTC